MNSFLSLCILYIYVICVVIRVSTSPTEVISIHGYDHSPYKSKENSSLMIIQYSICTQLNICALEPAPLFLFPPIFCSEYIGAENANVPYIWGKFAFNLVQI